MKEFVISEVKAETAVLVGLITKTQDEAKTKEYLDELEFLADTAGAVTVKRFTQKVVSPNQTTYVGKGKLEEIKQYIKDEEEEDREVGMVIFDDELSAKQIRNIEQELQVKTDYLTLIVCILECEGRRFASTHHHSPSYHPVILGLHGSKMRHHLLGSIKLRTDELLRKQAYCYWIHCF